MPETNITLTEKEKEEIYLSLAMRCGFIETGTQHRAKDFVNTGKKDRIKVLSTEQMRTIVFLEDLMKKVYLET